ncbi:MULTISPECIES: diguanylate cyclase [Desulfosediminicola]|uniref:GGDEF domain-containing response regulator n=1 Tax=Desulfosediminicola TaxID=2886823 RepID=UPI0010AD66B5|nr:diguanylate cyclase [Desulfosediminicola ganghwensis]
MEKPKDSAKILVVDDDSPVRLALKAMVTSLGYDCLVAEGGEQALAIMAENDIDMVLSDIVMPGMDGMELLGKIKKTHKDTDVIIATGFSGRVNYADVISAGAMDFIKKPIELAELEAKLARGFRERALVRRLEQLSLSDGLTGLLNRRAFDQRFTREVERANRQGYQLFLAIIDVDRFKEFNDTYGHQEGDQVLVALARVVVDCTRTNVDMCFRLGGDEFAILLPQTNSRQAQGIMKRVLNGFNAYQFGTTTLSIGLATCRRNIDVPVAEDEEMMKARADQAMYDAKNSGRNRIVCRG